MKIKTKEQLTVIIIMIPMTILILLSFYIHRNELHWFESKNVIIINK